MFILEAIASNTYLLSKLNGSRLAPHNIDIARQQQRPAFSKVFLKSHFIVPVLVSVTFSLFLGCALVESNVSDGERNNVNFFTFMLFNIMILNDAILFLAFEPRIRKMIKNRLRNWRDVRELAAQIRQRCTSCRNAENPEHRKNTTDIQTTSR